MTFTSVCYFARTDDSIPEMASGVCEFIQACIYNVTMVLVFVYRKEFKQLVDDLENAFKGSLLSWSCDFLFYYSPLTDIAKSEELESFYRDTLKTAFKIVVLYTIQVSTACFVYFNGPLLSDLLKLLQGRDDLVYPISLKADFIFFDPRSTTLGYIVFTIISKVHLTAYVIQFCFMDLLLATLLFYIGSYIRSISLRIQLLSEKIDSKVLNDTKAIKALKAIIVDHNAAIQMVKTFDNIFRIKILAQFLLFSVSFCFVLLNGFLVKFCFSINFFYHSTTLSFWTICRNCFSCRYSSRWRKWNNLFCVFLLPGFKARFVIKIKEF